MTKKKEIPFGNYLIFGFLSGVRDPPGFPENVSPNFRRIYFGWGLKAKNGRRIF
jgi:hypothetical protein